MIKLPFEVNGRLIQPKATTFLVEKNGRLIVVPH
jgi:hypothetical protein